MKANLHTALLALVLLATPTAAMTSCGRTPGDTHTGLGGDDNLNSGGSQSQGGTSETGGSQGQGGTTSSGGSKGQGGSVGSGGSKGQGGSVGSGGSKGQGGSVGSGGSKGQGGTIVPPRVPAVHRATAASCVGVNSPPEPNPTYTSPSSRCARHADCTEGTNGRCINGIGSAGSLYFCVYDECATDADCDPGKICHCNATASARCLSVGNCRTDADCGGGSYSYCSPSMGYDCGGYHSIDSYHCHTPADSCIDDSDCTGTDYCNYSDLTGRWTCTPINRSCVIG